MVKIAKRPTEELTELLEQELDDQLRVVLRIDPAGIERLFVRNDLALLTDVELGQSLARIFPRAREPADFLSAVAGGPEALIGFTDETVTALLYRHPNEAVAVAFDRTDNRALDEFVQRCLATLH